MRRDKVQHWRRRHFQDTKDRNLAKRTAHLGQERILCYAQRMVRIGFLLALFATPAFAQESDTGRDLMAEALRLFMKGMLEEMEPAIDDLSSLLDNLDAYHPPEILPNGDIIIRRKTPEEPPEGEVDL